MNINNYDPQKLANSINNFPVKLQYFFHLRHYYKLDYKRLSLVCGISEDEALKVDELLVKRLKEEYSKS